MSNAPKTGQRTKHWVGYMFGDWGRLCSRTGCAEQQYHLRLQSAVRAKMNAMKAGNK